MEEQQDNTALVEEMLRQATRAEEPGDMKINQIVPDGSKELPIAVNSLESAGYVYIYDTKSGEPSVINRNMLASKLKQKRVDGSFVFSMKQTVTPVRGTYKCLLHPESPNRANYDSLGFPVCRKCNLTSPFQVERHMQKRHKQEWETIKAEKEKQERQEDRAFQRSIIKMAYGETPNDAKQKENDSEEDQDAELYVSDKPYQRKKKKK